MPGDEGDERTAGRVHRQRRTERHVVDEDLAGVEAIAQLGDLAPDPLGLPQQVVLASERLVADRRQRTGPGRGQERLDLRAVAHDAVVGARAEPQRRPLEAVVLDAGAQARPGGDDDSRAGRSRGAGEHGQRRVVRRVVGTDDEQAHRCSDGGPYSSTSRAAIVSTE